MFTVVPAVDRYNGQDLGGFRISGYCRHLSCESVIYVNEADAQRWVDVHVATFHGEDKSARPDCRGCFDYTLSHNH